MDDYTNTHIDDHLDTGTQLRRYCLVASSAIAAVCAIFFITLLTIGGELYTPLKNLLAEQHHHHWIGKGIWAVSLFVVVWLVTFFIIKPTPPRLARLLWMVTLSSIVGTLLLYGFFVYEFFHH